MSKLTAGQTVGIPGFILEGERGFMTWSEFEMPEHGYVTITPHTLTFTVPEDFNSVASQVAVLNKKLDSMADEYHGKVAQIRERIAELMCIENSPA